MKDNVFIDTNIWVYASLEIDTDLPKRDLAVKLIQNRNSIFVSTQVLNEFYNVLLKYKIKIQKSWLLSMILSKTPMFVLKI